METARSSSGQARDDDDEFYVNLAHHFLSYTEINVLAKVCKRKLGCPVILEHRVDDATITRKRRVLH